MQNRARSLFMMMLSGAGIAFAAPASIALAQDQFKPPVRIEAAAGPISVEIGHAAPYLHDMDGDGVRDLLVGQFGSGKLRIYRNHGTEENPEYRDFEYFRAGHEYGTVPTG